MIDCSFNLFCRISTFSVSASPSTYIERPKQSKRFLENEKEKERDVVKHDIENCSAANYLAL